MTDSQQIKSDNMPSYIPVYSVRHSALFYPTALCHFVTLPSKEITKFKWFVVEYDTWAVLYIK